MNKIKDVQKFLKENREKALFLFSQEYKCNTEERFKIYEFNKSFKTEEKNFSGFTLQMEVFFVGEHLGKEGIELANKIYDWCWINNIPMFNVVNIMASIYIGQRALLDEIFNEYLDMDSDMCFDFSDKNNHEYIWEQIQIHFLESIEEYVNTPRKLKLDEDMYRQLIVNTYEKIKENVLLNIKNAKIPLAQYSINQKDILDDIEQDENNLLSIIGNPRQFSKIKSEQHYLNHLTNDDLDYDEDGKLFFRGHSKALSLGYTNKAILLSLDKNSSIRELKTKIKHLEHYKTEESENLIEFTEKLILFIMQKRHANIIPFKALAKEVGLTKNQAKNYTKKLYSINDKSFSANFEHIQLLDK